MIALEGILDEVMGAFGASSASICLQNADSDKLMIEVERGLSKSGQGFELPMGSGDYRLGSHERRTFFMCGCRK